MEKQGIGGLKAVEKQALKNRHRFRAIISSVLSVVRGRVTSWPTAAGAAKRVAID